MQNLSGELNALLILLLIVAIPCLAILLWKARIYQLRRRDANELKLGNKIYREWRRITQRQPLE
jgi:hypothetical protein